MRIILGLVFGLWIISVSAIADASIVATGEKGLFDVEEGLPGEATSDFDTGAGDTLPWATTDDIYVGYTSTGTLGISSTFELNKIFLGLANGSTGTINVTSGGDFTFNDIDVGVYGSGEVNFTDCVITGDTLRLGHQDVSGVGTGTIDNSNVTLSGINIAKYGTGTVTIQNNSTVTTTTGWIHLGEKPGSNGTLIVDNSTFHYGANWIYLGTLGEGHIEFRNGSVVDSVIMQIGSSDDGTNRGQGSVLVDNSTWDAAEIIIGHGADGAVTAQNNSSVSVENHFILGNQAGSTASLTIDNSTFTAMVPGRNFRIGQSGDANVTIRNGGEFITGKAAWGTILSNAEGAHASVVIDNGTWTFDTTDVPDITYDSNAVYVANAVGGTCSIEVVNGGIINGADSNFYCGRNGNAEILVDGAGSTWTSNEFWIGMNGMATGTISNGGVVITDHKGMVRNINGATLGGDSVMTVSGEGSAWNIVGWDSYFEVGAASDTGQSKLIIKDSGLVSVEPETKVYAGQMTDSESGIYLSGGGGLACYAGWDYSSSLVDFLDWSVSSSGFSGGSGVYYWDATAGDWADVLDGTLGTDYTLEYISNSSDPLYGYNVLAGVAAMPEEEDPIPGDANKDGKVDGSDVTILAGNWQYGVTGTPDARWDMGDFNGDGKVDGSDVTILAGNWQAGVESAASAVPEPGTIALLLSAFASLLIWKRRR